MDSQPVVEEESTTVFDEKKFLYLSGRSVEDMQAVHIYAYDLENDNLHKVTSGDFRYDFNTPDPGYVVMFGRYFGGVDTEVAGPEVPMWLNLETGRGSVFEVPNGFSKRQMSIAEDYLAYQQKATTSAVDETGGGYGWETIIYETSTNRYVDLQGVFSPVFLGGDRHIALLDEEDIYMYDTVSAELRLISQLKTEVGREANMDADLAGQNLLVSTRAGHSVYEITSMSPVTIQEIFSVNGNYGSGLLSDSGEVYYIVNKGKTNPVGVWVEKRDTKTGDIVDSFRISGFVDDNFSLDGLRSELFVAEFLQEKTED